MNMTFFRISIAIATVCSFLTACSSDGNLPAGGQTPPSEPEEELIDTSLCMPDPSKQAQKVYQYLRSQWGKKIFSGTMANVNWNFAEAELVHKATGKYPAINFLDFISLYASPASWIDYSQTASIEGWWNKNGLVGAGWHWNVPKSETAPANEVSFNAEETSFSAANATVEGTWENRVIKNDLEKVAGYLMLLQNKGIPVIWRPLHEASGNIYQYAGGKAWFWWGANGAEAYKKLWRYMFDFFRQKGLNNLIWVWTSQTKDVAFYPGDEYVDIIGRDCYNELSASEIASQYNELKQMWPHKLITLSECGSVAKIKEQWKAAAKWSFFMPWYHYNATSLSGHQHADNTWWKDAMEQEYVLTRDDLPSLK